MPLSITREVHASAAKCSMCKHAMQQASCLEQQCTAAFGTQCAQHCPNAMQQQPTLLRRRPWHLLRPSAARGPAGGHPAQSELQGEHLSAAVAGSTSHDALQPQNHPTHGCRPGPPQNPTGNAGDDFSSLLRAVMQTSRSQGLVRPRCSLESRYPKGQLFQTLLGESARLCAHEPWQEAPSHQHHCRQPCSKPTSSSLMGEMLCSCTCAAVPKVSSSAPQTCWQCPGNPATSSPWSVGPCTPHLDGGAQSKEQHAPYMVEPVGAGVQRL